MARRRSSETKVDVFPFLDVLVCAIGSLIAIILAISMLSIKSPTIMIEVKGAPQKKKPVYIECHKDTIVIHPEKTVVLISELETEDSPFLRLAKRIRDEQRMYVVYAVYPDGIKTFNEIKEISVRYNVSMGYEPMDFGWKLEQ